MKLIELTKWNSPGIYFLTDKRGKVVYVGKSKNISARVGAHFYNKTKNGVKLGAVRSFFLPQDAIENHFNISESLDIFEAYFIAALKPKFNKVRPSLNFFTEMTISKVTEILPELLSQMGDQ